MNSRQPMLTDASIVSLLAAAAALHPPAGQMRFAPHSLRVRFQNLAGRVSMDLRAVQNLELLPQYSGGGGGGGEVVVSGLNSLFIPFLYIRWGGLMASCVFRTNTDLMGEGGGGGGGGAGGLFWLP